MNVIWLNAKTDLEKVYGVATGHVPVLLRHLGVLIHALETDVGWDELDAHAPEGGP